ncbi:MAG: histidine kinase [Bacteroidota bacterium]
MPNNKAYNILGQTLFWVLTWMFVTFMLLNAWEDPQRYFSRIWISFLGIAIVVTVNLQYLLPKFFFSQQRTAFVLLGILLIVAITLFFYWDSFPWVEWLNEKTRGGRPSKNTGRRYYSGFRWLNRFMPFLIALLGSTLFEIASYVSRKEKEVVQSQKEKLETEIKFLRSQINPHFLFNALNNIYTLTLIQSKSAPENLLRLSDMLRYMLYDGEAKKVPLQKEIIYLKNYINLQQLKDSEGLNVTFELDESQPNLMVPPLLLIPFVENAFKHSQIEDQAEGWITIVLETTIDQLNFKVENSIPATDFKKDKVGGIGLENVKRRLALLYPNQHSLEIRSVNQVFTVELRLDLSTS